MSEIIDVKLSGVRWLTAVRFPKVVLSGFVCLLTLALWQTPDQPVSHAVDIPIPTQADWTDYGTIFEAGAVGEWDYQLWGGFAGTAVKHDGTYYLYYQGASGYQLVPDETVTWRSIGVASSPDGVNFTKYSDNPVVSWFPTLDGEEGAASGGAALDENGDIALIYGANTAIAPTLVNADGRLTTSSDGFNFTDMGIVLNHKNLGLWGAGDELFPVIAFQDGGQWFIYYIPNGSGTGRTLGAAWGSSLESLTNSARVESGGTAVSAWGMGGSAKVATDVYALFINDVTQAKTEVRTVSLSDPAQASAPLATYQFPGVTQATILLDEATHTWFMYYRGVDEYGLKLAPAGPPDTTPPTAPNDVTAVPLNDREIELSWQPATDTETGIVLYNVFRDGVQIATVKGWLYKDTGLAEQQEHSYEVSAVNYHGVTGPLSAPVTATTLADTTVPQVLTVNATGSGDQVTLTFDEPIEATSAEEVLSYVIDGLDVLTASLMADQQTVVLTTADHVNNNYHLTLRSILDQAATPNAIAPTAVNYIYTGLDGLAGAWSFESFACNLYQQDNTHAFDTANFGNDGTLLYSAQPGPFTTEGVRGRALKFDGVDDQVTLDGSGSLAEVTDDSYTFAAWVQPDSIPPAASDNDTAYSILVRAYTGLYYDANQTFRAEILLADGTRTAVSSSEFSPNEWHHVAMTVDNAQHLLHLYVDGQEVGNSPVPYMGSLADHQDAPYYIGTSEPLTNRYEYRFSGLVDEVQIYNRALSPEEISHLFDWAAEDEPQFFCVHIPMIQKNKVAGASCGK